MRRRPSRDVSKPSRVPAVLILLLALVIGFIIAATLLPIVIMQLGAATI